MYSFVKDGKSELMEFRHSFTINAPVAAVADFHYQAGAMKQLTPFPLIMRVHTFEPVAEDSQARFTLWFGPLPVQWHAIHSQVTPRGFTDTQVSGPLQAWRHSHHFVAVDAHTTRVEDHIIYEHARGIKGLLSRLMFSRPGLLYLFTARKYLTRRGVTRLMAAQRANSLVN